MANNRLTWQNVDAPDFRGVSDSYRTMSALLERATQSGQGMLDVIRNTNTEAADRAIMQRMLGVRDPNNFDPNAILGGDAKNASLATIAGVGRHEDTLIDRAGTRLNQEVTRGNYDWTKGARDQTLQYGPQMQAALAAAAQGDRSGLNNPAFAGMRADLYTDFLRDGTSAASSDMSLKTSGQNLTEDQYAFANLKLNDDTRRQAEGVMQDLWTNSFDGPSALRRFGELTKGMEPRVVQALRSQMASVYPAQFGFSPSAGGGAPTGSAPTTGSAWAKSSGLMGNESGGNYGAQNSAVGSGGKVGHFGALQFGHDRLSDAKRAGVIPQDMTAEQFRTSGADVQDRVADWHFEDIDKQAKNSGLEEHYGKVINGVTINRDSIRAMAHLGGVGGVKKFIQTNGSYNPADTNNTRLSDYGQRFGQSASATPLEVMNSQLDTTRAGDKANSSSVSERLAANIGKRRAPYVVAKDLAESFPETSETALQEGITNLMAEHQVTADQAAELMLQNRPSMERGFLNPLRWLGNRFDVDTDITGTGGRNAVGSMLQTAATNASRDQVVAKTGEVAAQIQGIEAQIALVTQRIEALGPNSGLVSELNRLTAEREKLVGTQGQVMNIQQNNQDFTSDDLALMAQLQEQQNAKKLEDGGTFWRGSRSEAAIREERTRRMIQALERSKL